MNEKKAAGYAAVDRFVASGMRLGMGTGSTVFYALERLEEKIRSGELEKLLVVPTSLETHWECQKRGIPLTDLSDSRLKGRLDLAIDGADEVDPKGNLIKGGGGALLQEKVIAHAAEKFIVIVDQGKLKESLGSDFPLPLEVLNTAWALVKSKVESLGAEISFRPATGKRGPVITDNGHFLMDARFPKPVQPAEMEQTLSMIPGLLENGLFTGLSPIVMVGKSEGSIEIREN